MGINPRGRSRGRSHNFNNNRRHNNNINKNTVYDSIGPAGRIRGSAYQLMEKYQSVAKEMMSTDRVLAESCLQHAEHYMRINAMFTQNENRQNQNASTNEEATTNEEVAVNENVSEDTENAELQVAEDKAEEMIETETSDDELKAVAQMDLSVPVATMVENENKSRKGRLVIRKAVDKKTTDEVPASPKRRGRPPSKKTVEIA